MNKLPYNATRVLNDGFVGLVDHMGDDSAIVQAARVSYNLDSRYEDLETQCLIDAAQEYSTNSHPQNPDVTDVCISESSISVFGNEEWNPDNSNLIYEGPISDTAAINILDNAENKLNKAKDKDRNLIRYLMRHRHTTPFEMVEFKFIVRVSMDCWRQWIRHRTASVNEYSTRYTEAIDSCQTTKPDQWRLQAKSNKQGSSGYLEPGILNPTITDTPKSGHDLTQTEEQFQEYAKNVYKERLALGVAKEQARKDLPLSNYTEAYWKIDLHNLFHFLSLRMDSHAQLEIRSYANAIYELIKPVVPIACEAFEDYRLNGQFFSAQEMKCLETILHSFRNNMSDGILDTLKEKTSKRELQEFKAKLKI